MKRIYESPILEIINVDKEDIVLYTSTNLLGYYEVDWDGTGDGWTRS